MRLPAEILKINYASPEPAIASYIADCLKRGMVVAIPTDTFYGLAVDPINLRAVGRVYEIKSRSVHKPLSMLVEDMYQAQELSKNSSELFFQLARKFWPGPLTIIMKASSKLPLKVTANTGNVALRVPDCRFARDVVSLLGLPITATAANLPGEAEPTTAEAVMEQIGKMVPLIVDGGMTPHSVPSTIVDLTDEEDGWRVVREGAIRGAQIAEALA
jgi:L-threonylcarbamoyladenylate synthase